VKAKNILYKAAVLICLFCSIGFTLVAGGETQTPLQAKIEVSTGETLGKINEDIYGLFMELLKGQFTGGIWAEMLQNRKFAEEDMQDDEQLYGVVKSWYSIGRNKDTHFAHDNTVYYSGSQSQKIISENQNNKGLGIGQDKLYLESGRGYNVWLNLFQKGITGPVAVTLEGEGGTYARQTFEISEGKWERFEFTLHPSRTDRNGKFTITFSGTGTLWVGTASLMPEDNISGYRKDVVDALKEIKPPNIRWPGGNFVSAYHWEDGIGDRDKRPPRFDRAWAAHNLWQTNDVGTDEFIELCRILDTKPYMAVNAGDGTAEEAANLVEYCNGGPQTKYGRQRAENGHPEPYNIKLWGIGNEMFGNWQIGHVDEQTYAKRHRDIAKAMLAVDKDIKIVAVGGRYWKYPQWNKALFDIAGDYFDYLSLHSYAKKYRRTLKKEDLKDPKLAEEIYYYTASAPYGVEEQIIETDKEIRAALPARGDIRIAFDEWNMELYRGDTTYALRDGIYTAGILHAFRRQHEAVTLANFACTINSLPMIKVNQYGMFFNPAYLVFKMYCRHGGPSLIKTAVECESFAAPEYEKGRPQAIGQIKYLDASATVSEDEKTLYLAVINLHSQKITETQVIFDKWNYQPTVNIYELYDDDYMTENTFENPDRLKITENELNNVTNNFSYTFKPHSVTVMEFHKTD
jgi:alpha-N-arabinofuranosidase